MQNFLHLVRESESFEIAHQETIRRCFKTILRRYAVALHRRCGAASAADAELNADFEQHRQWLETRASAEAGRKPRRNVNITLRGEGTRRIMASHAARAREWKVSYRMLSTKQHNSGADAVGDSGPTQWKFSLHALAL